MDRPTRSLVALRDERGQTAPEYIALIVVIAAAILAVSFTDFGEAVRDKVVAAVEALAVDSGGGGGEGGAAPGGGEDGGGDEDGGDDPSFLESAGGAALDAGGDVAGAIGDGAGAAWDAGGALVNGAVLGDFNREGYDNPILEGFRAAGQFASGLVVVGDVRDAFAAGDRILSSGGREGWGDLGLSAFGAIPLFGDVAKGVKGVDSVADVARGVDRARDGTRATDGARAADEGRPPSGRPRTPDPAAGRVKLRDSTKEAIQREAPKTSDGDFIDPNTGQVIPGEGPFDYGHKPGFEWWRTQQRARSEGWTREQVIEYENDPSHYQIEDPSANRSHRYEEPR